MIREGNLMECLVGKTPSGQVQMAVGGHHIASVRAGVCGLVDYLGLVLKCLS